MQQTHIILLALNGPLLAAAVYANQVLHDLRLYTVFKLIESSLVCLIAFLKPNKQFRLKQLVFQFYLLGDYIIITKLVPAAFAFTFGHILFIVNKKYYRMSLKDVVGTLAITVPIPFALRYFGLVKGMLLFGMCCYILGVALIFKMTIKDKTAGKTMKFATFMFYLSDSLLCLRQFTGQFMGEFGNFVFKVLVLLTYFTATNIYAICL